MATAIRVEAAVAGRRRAGVGEHDLTVTIPSGSTLRDLIVAVVFEEVSAFDRRREQRAFVHVLTDREIADGVVSGRVHSENFPVGAPVHLLDATATALQAFDDGLYQVYVDDEPIDSLEQVVHIHQGTRLMFLRLVALAGG